MLTEDIITQWTHPDFKRSLDTWKEYFSVVNSAADGDKISEGGLRTAQGFMHLAKDYQVSSPANNKGSNVIQVNKLNVTGDESDTTNSFVELMMVDPTDLVNKRKSVEDLNHYEGSRKKIVVDEEFNVPQAITTLEMDREIGDARVFAIATKLDGKEMFFSNEVRFLLSRLEATETTIGTRIISGHSPYQAPTIWGSIAALATGAEETEAKRIENNAALNEELAESITQIRTYVDTAIHRAVQEVNQTTALANAKLQDLVRAQTMVDENILSIARGTMKLKDDFRMLTQGLHKHRADSHSHDSNKLTTPSTKQNLVINAKLEEVLRKVTAVSEQVAQMRSESDGEAVRFFGLGFREPREAEAWAAAHLAMHSYGIVVDAHLVFEHIYNAVTTTEGGAIARLHSLYKLRIDNLTQAAAITSFESRIPKLFSKSSSISGNILKRHGTSHFDQVASYGEWSEPGTGFRARIKEELLNFEQTHTLMIEDGLSPDTKAYNISKLALTESVAWIQQLMSYMEDTYKDLIRQNSFTVEKAWQLTTQLAKRILMEVSTPRMGVLNLLQVGDNDRTGLLMFWPVIRSHDIMKRYKESSFKDDPAIASEYVKFLASNSGSEVTEKLTSKMTAIETEMKAFAKLVNGVEKSAGQGMNKIDEANKKLADLQKRVAKVEGAKHWYREGAARDEFMQRSALLFHDGTTHAILHP
jgi:hypothetical protein